MSLRWKIALAMAVIVSITTIAFGAASYRSTRDRLLAEVDHSLSNLNEVVIQRRQGVDVLPEQGPLSGYSAQILLPDGSVGQSTFSEPVVPDDETRTLIGEPNTNRFTTVDTADGEYRMRTVGLQRGAVQVGRPLEETNRVLASLRNRTLVLALLVVVAAVLAGLWIAGRVTASLRRLTLAAERVESTGRLDIEITTEGDDEVGRLGSAFDRMLMALSRSRSEQHRLVQDAGHELRTPLTSIRTNLDTLRRFPGLPDADRDAIIEDLRAETVELTDLVNEIVEVATGEMADEPMAPFDLAELAAEVSSRYERRTGRQIVVVAEATPVEGQRKSVQRAVSCLLDNARKFDASDQPIEVSVRDGAVAVADRGIGIDPADRDAIFERFHRADGARSMPGSGLGLSIVREVAERHGGEVFARPRDGGGAVVGFSVAAADR